MPPRGGAGIEPACVFTRAAILHSPAAGALAARPAPRPVGGPQGDSFVHHLPGRRAFAGGPRDQPLAASRANTALTRARSAGVSTPGPGGSRAASTWIG